MAHEQLGAECRRRTEAVDDIKGLTQVVHVTDRVGIMDTPDSTTREAITSLDLKDDLDRASVWRLLVLAVCVMGGKRNRIAATLASSICKHK